MFINEFLITTTLKFNCITTKFNENLINPDLKNE